MPSCSKCSLPYLKKKFKFKRPTKATIVSLVGWYATRALVGLLWCAVVWAFIGKDAALPAYRKSNDQSPCVTQYDLNNESLYDILDSLTLPLNTAEGESTFGNFSYLYTCNDDGNDQYCLGLDMDCVNNQLSMCLYCPILVMSMIRITLQRTTILHSTSIKRSNRSTLKHPIVYSYFPKAISLH